MMTHTSYTFRMPRNIPQQPLTNGHVIRPAKPPAACLDNSRAPGASQAPTRPLQTLAESVALLEINVVPTPRCPTYHIRCVQFDLFSASTLLELFTTQTAEQCRGEGEPTRSRVSMLPPVF